MSEEFVFPPYGEKLQELIKEFGGTLMEEYQGYDIKPLWDQKGEGYTGYKYLYKAPKLEKIALGVGAFREKLMTYALMIWPDDDHALPIYSSYWADSAKGSFFILDLYPVADCIRDLSYPMGQYAAIKKWLPWWFYADCSDRWVLRLFVVDQGGEQEIDMASAYLDELCRRRAPRERKGRDGTSPRRGKPRTATPHRIVPLPAHEVGQVDGDRDAVA